MFAVAAVLLAQADRPALASWTSGRPPECVDAAGGNGANVWERAKAPTLRRYCDLVAGASSKLAGGGTMTQAALETARQAELILPGHAAPHILEGRALYRLGKLDEARAALLDAHARAGAAFEDDPTALLAWSRVEARTGHPDAAIEGYRTLLPRASALGAPDRGHACIEAGMLESALRGKDGIDEATAALREGVRESRDEALVVAVLALALTLDRRGDIDEARALLTERAQGDPRAWLVESDARELLAIAPGEEPALVAIGLEASDPAGARAAWEKYLASSPSGPWAAEARSHLADLAAPGKKSGSAHPLAAGLTQEGRR